MSDIHPLPLLGHDLEHEPLIRAKVWRTTPQHWWWSYLYEYDEANKGRSTLRHGPFVTQGEAYDSAWRMVEAL